jgi:lysozyme
MNVNPLVIDLSHWDPAYDYAAVKADGIVGVIYKATEGGGYCDDTYVQQQHAAKAAGLKWGAYHFADGSSTQGQVDNFLRFAAPDPDELFCLDWEDNPSGNGCMSADEAEEWITRVETALGRPGQCVIYSGNTAKEQIDGQNEFFGSRRLWLCQYGNSPSWQESWEEPWLWQFTDGVYGPTPHSIDGVGPCDINSYDEAPEQLIAEWATGKEEAEPKPPVPPSLDAVTVIVAAPPGVVVKVRQMTLGQTLGAEARKGMLKVKPPASWED